MTSLKSLIKNQKIRIDDHHWGNGEIKNWDDNSKDIHLDKRTKYKIRGKLQEVTIKIPLNSNRPIKIESDNQKFSEIPNSLYKEIKSAFKNSNVRNHFIVDIAEILKNFNSLLDDEEKVFNAIKKISIHFDLRWEDEVIKIYIGNALISYTQIFRETDGKFFISVNKSEIVISDTQNMNSYDRLKYLRGVNQK